VNPTTSTLDPSFNEGSDPLRPSEPAEKRVLETMDVDDEGWTSLDDSQRTPITAPTPSSEESLSKRIAMVMFYQPLITQQPLKCDRAAPSAIFASPKGSTSAFLSRPHEGSSATSLPCHRAHLPAVPVTYAQAGCLARLEHQLLLVLCEYTISPVPHTVSGVF
jgi:hypothetical protein